MSDDPRLTPLTIPTPTDDLSGDEPPPDEGVADDRSTEDGLDGDRSGDEGAGDDGLSDHGPAHYRLSGVVWTIILGEYLRGATVPMLAAKWRVSEHALRKRITRHEATKRDHGDREAMAHAAAWEARAAEEREKSPEARAARLFDPDPNEPAEASDVAALARTAIVASGRAMRGRLWAEAKALAGLAESYARLSDRVQLGRLRDPEEDDAATIYLADRLGIDLS